MRKTKTFENVFQFIQYTISPKYKSNLNINMCQEMAPAAHFHNTYLVHGVRLSGCLRTTNTVCINTPQSVGGEINHFVNRPTRPTHFRFTNLF